MAEEEQGMNQATYNQIAKEQPGYWGKNVVLLRKAIQYIDDEQNTLWIDVMSLLPREHPAPRPENELKGIKAIIVVRNYLKNKNYLNDVKNAKFPSTYEWTQKHKDKLGYDYDDFTYSHSPSNKIEMTWTSDKGRPYHNCHEEFDRSLGITCLQFEDGEVKRNHQYINAVDHFYTNLIWLVVSGKQSTAFGNNKNGGLFYTVADILGFKPKNYEMSCKELKDSESMDDEGSTLSDMYTKMLSDAAEEVK